ncbi:MAG: N-6 DNA methylase [Promethearchaeota archaeon]
MLGSTNPFPDKLNRRRYGEHLTSTDMFLKFIFPEIQERLKNHIWVDLYSGEGNLVLPILNFIPEIEREAFFEKRIYLFDVQEKMVEKCINNAIKYGISQEIAQKNIKIRDNLDKFPDILKNSSIPIFHITNPPYLYLGYIRKHKETQKYLKYFEGKNKGYQDLYQIAMINDLRNNIDEMVYIIPSNFLFGASVSNKFRKDFLRYYNIAQMYIFETKMFEFTGTNTCIGFFKRKKKPNHESIQFSAKKFKKHNQIIEKKYILKSKYKYRAGSEFNEFCEEYKARKPLTVKYYLLKEEVKKYRGKNEITVIDANKYENNNYKQMKLHVNDDLKYKIESNILFVQTVDKGSLDGRVGLKKIKDEFKVKGIYVSSNTYRTHPIQIFLQPIISEEDQILLMNYFNLILEYYRKELDSEFLTTYKYSDATYTRKYLGLTQVRMLIETFPIRELNDEKKAELLDLIKKKIFSKILSYLENFL